MHIRGLRQTSRPDRSALLTIYLLPESQYRMQNTSSRSAFQIRPAEPPPSAGLFLPCGIPPKLPDGLTESARFRSHTAFSDQRKSPRPRVTGGFLPVPAGASDA